MKKFFLIVAPLAAMLSSCGFDDEEIRYPVTKALFTYQQYNRQLVVGEGLQMQLGVVYSGVLNNTSDKVVKYAIKPEMVPSDKTALPSNYYHCGNATDIVVPGGSLKGYMPVVMDSLKFVGDPRSLTGEFVLAVKILSTEGIDQVASDKDSTLISVSYLGKQYGKYTYTGTRTDGTNTETYQNTSTNGNSIRQLITIGPDKFRFYPDQTSGDPTKGTISFLLQVPVHGGGNVTITPDPDNYPAVSVSADGASTYDESTKTFKLRYKYTVSGTEWKAEDTMVFRSRERDDQGDNRILYEWRGF